MNCCVFFCFSTDNLALSLFSPPPSLLYPFSGQQTAALKLDPQGAPK